MLKHRYLGSKMSQIASFFPGKFHFCWKLACVKDLTNIMSAWDNLRQTLFAKSYLAIKRGMVEESCITSSQFQKRFNSNTF